MEAPFQIFLEREFSSLHHQGFSQRQVSGTTRVSIGYVNKIVQNYVDNNTSLPPTRKHKTLLITVTDSRRDYRKFRNIK